MKSQFSFNLPVFVAALLMPIVILALAGCSSQHAQPPKPKVTAPAKPAKLTATQQASENAQQHLLSGGPLTSNAPSLADFSLSGYGKPPKQ
ncbi:MAG: hypothetical protein PHO57_07400 [Acidithiobacillus sp.]|nr:hypothetical protein [Acidithiobacillus sp.]